MGTPVARCSAPKSFQSPDDPGREAGRIGGQRASGHDAHELPVARGGVLARTERVQAAVEGGRVGRRYAFERDDRAKPKTFERRQPQAPDSPGEVPERVRSRVSVVRGVGKRPRTARVEDDDERSPSRWTVFAQAERSPMTARGWALK